MSSSYGGPPLPLCDGAQDGFVRVRKTDLEKLTTEVMQLREFLPRVVNSNLIGMLHKNRVTQTVKDHITQEQEYLQQECLHLQSRLDVLQIECQKEREEKLLLREKLWQSGAELQQQADFCFSLGSAVCSLLWNCSTREDLVKQWLVDATLPAFLAVATQTLGSFISTLDEDVKSRYEDYNTQEYQFVLALTGTITNIAAVTCGRDFLCSSGHGLLDTLIKLLELMKPGVLPKLKVLMLMGLYNASISVKGLKYMIEKPALLPLIRTLLEDRSWEVCLHSLRLLQSLLLEDVAQPTLGAALLDMDLQARIRSFTLSVQPSLRQLAQQTLADLQGLMQVQGCKQNKQ
ncbi:heat shock factor 2-binding protein [Syngnathoides biaculeatus]|uniref:heat shock factor 2-binding protein n=1 Tax=Syngnathoides biaculeatus TaxID=300417 RepID=UPI002ADDB6F9|nr:heat shock factor 2-binding protein [Syngnathoides biaculeatus]XP_061692283.1 heat shock factor 2-binding protein [Syngnathoides biaculeatus]